MDPSYQNPNQPPTSPPNPPTATFNGSQLPQQSPPPVQSSAATPPPSPYQQPYPQQMPPGAPMGSPYYPPQAPRSNNKTLIIVASVVGGVILLGIIGFIGLLILGSTMSDTKDDQANTNTPSSKQASSDGKWKKYDASCYSFEGPAEYKFYGEPGECHGGISPEGAEDMLTITIVPQSDGVEPGKYLDYIQQRMAGINFQDPKEITNDHGLKMLRFSLENKETGLVSLGYYIHDPAATSVHVEKNQQVKVLSYLIYGISSDQTDPSIEKVAMTLKPHRNPEAK